jgi:hypothetical protein
MEEGGIDFDFDTERLSELHESFIENTRLNEQLSQYEKGTAEYTVLLEKISENKTKACKIFTESIRLEDDPVAPEKLKTFFEDTADYTQEQGKKINMTELQNRGLGEVETKFQKSFVEPLRKAFKKVGEKLKLSKEEVDTAMEDPSGENSKRIAREIVEQNSGKGKFATAVDILYKLIVIGGILTLGALGIGALIGAADEMSGCYYTYDGNIQQLTKHNECSCCNKGCEKTNDNLNPKCCSNTTCQENAICSCVKYNAFDVLGKAIAAAEDLISDGADFAKKLMQLIIKYWWVFVLLIALGFGAKIYSTAKKK